MTPNPQSTADEGSGVETVVLSSEKPLRMAEAPLVDVMVIGNVEPVAVNE